VNCDNSVLEVLRDASSLIARAPALTAGEAIHEAVASRPGPITDTDIEAAALRAVLAQLSRGDQQAALVAAVEGEEEA
jgi:hypothetical protein